MDNKKFLTEIQRAMVQAGSKISVDGVWGPLSRIEFEKYEFQITATKKTQPEITSAPWLDEAKKHEGQKESEPVFNKYMSSFWKIVGLPNFKTIVGTSFAWCGLFVASVLYTSDLPWQKNGAGAKNWAKYGQEINWRENGIPRGAILHLNHKGKCDSGSSNHVGFANGDCTAEHLSKKDATIEVFGGNQSNSVKTSTFAVSEVCAVRWPSEVVLPPKVLKSTACSGGERSDESTR